VARAIRDGVRSTRWAQERLAYTSRTRSPIARPNPKGVVHVRLAIEPDKRIADDVLQTAKSSIRTERTRIEHDSHDGLREAVPIVAKAWLKSSTCRWLVNRGNGREALNKAELWRLNP